MIFILVSCEPGTFRNIQTLNCDDCDIGFYQNQSNQLFCYSCPSGFTTITSNATQEDQCIGRFILELTMSWYSLYIYNHYISHISCVLF